MMHTPTQQPIGILGGTFDPIHFGHLRTAIELHQTLNLSEVRLIPCYQPVHRHQPMATPLQRLTMLKLAIDKEPALCIDTCEIDRQGPSYMIDTLSILSKKFPHTPLCLIIGIDALLEFNSWHRYQEILQLSHLIVVHRPPYQLPQNGTISDLVQQHRTQTINVLHECLNGYIYLQAVTALDISATDIRKQIAAGKNPRYLLPDNVYHYIQEHTIYQREQA